MKLDSNQIKSCTGLGTVTGSPELSDNFLATFKSYLVNTGELRLHAVIGGCGEPLLLHCGWPQCWYAWRHLMLPLTKHFTVIAVDPRGLGVSGKVDTGFDVDTLALDMFHLMDTLGFEKFRMVGHDIGVMVGYAMAAMRPERISRLAVGEGTIPGASPSPELIPDNHRVNEFLWHFAFNRASSITEELVKGREDIYFNYQFSSKGASDNAVPKYARDFYIELSQKIPGVLKAGFDYYRAMDETIVQVKQHKNKKITVPVFAFSGALACGEMVVVEQRNLAKNVQSLIIPDCGHFPAEEKPEILLKAVQEFLLKSDDEIVHKNKRNLKSTEDLHRDKPIVLAGASGKLGMQIAKSLLTKPGIKLRLLVRPGSLNKVDDLRKKGAEIFEVDIDDTGNTEIMNKAMHGSYAVVSAVTAVSSSSKVMIDGQLRLLEAAREAGVKRFIPSCYSYDINGLDKGENYNTDILQDFSMKAENVRGSVEVVQIQIGAFIDRSILFGFLGAFDVDENIAFLWGDGSQKMDFTTYKNTAEFTAEVAIDDRKLPNIMQFSGDTLTFHELVSAYEEGSGSTVTVNYLGTLEDLKSEIEKRRKQQPDNIFAWLPLMYWGAMLSGKVKLHGISNSRYPDIDVTTVSEYVHSKLKS